MEGLPTLSCRSEALSNLKYRISKKYTLHPKRNEYTELMFYSSRLSSKALPHTFLNACDQLSAWTLQLRYVEERLRVLDRTGNGAELLAAGACMPAAEWWWRTWSGPVAAAGARSLRPMDRRGSLLPAGRAARSGWSKPAASCWCPCSRKACTEWDAETELDCLAWVMM